MSEPKKLQDFLKHEFPKLESYLGEGLMYERTKVVVYGKYKSFKSYLLFLLAYNLARGEPWLGINTNKEGVGALYLQLEIPEQLLQDRVRDTLRTDVATKKDLILWTEHNLKLDSKSGMDRLKPWLEKYQPQVLIVDPLYKVLSVDMSSNYALNYVLEKFDELIDEFDLSLILATHSRKPSKDEDNRSWGVDNILGGVLLPSWADTVLEVVRGGANEVTLNREVVRHARGELEPIRMMVDSQLHFNVLGMTAQEKKFKPKEIDENSQSNSSDPSG